MEFGVLLFEFITRASDAKHLFSMLNQYLNHIENVLQLKLGFQFKTKLFRLKTSVAFETGIFENETIFTVRITIRL